MMKNYICSTGTTEINKLNEYTNYLMTKTQALRSLFNKLIYATGDVKRYRSRFCRPTIACQIGTGETPLGNNIVRGGTTVNFLFQRSSI